MIIVVSGLPRSGTSMMMRILEKGGVSILTDNVRKADNDNLKGYYEFEKVKQLDRDRSWLNSAEGKAVKIISALLKHLPPDHQYKVIFMKRDIDEILASQKKMMERRGEKPEKVPDEMMGGLFEKHLKETKEWLNENSIETLYVNYNDVLEEPLPHLRRVNEFLSKDLDLENMVGVVGPDLYRQRGDQLP
jgi:broad-specificity NMP kinase